MPTHLNPERRRLAREEVPTRANLVVNLGGREARFTCLILDSSENGFRVGWTLQLRCGQAVELFLNADPFNAVGCSVIWVGRPGSELEGEAGLKTV